MAIAPLSWPVAHINSEMDFSPLAKIGEMLKQQREEADAAEQIKRLYERAGQAQQPIAPPVAQQPPPRAAQPSAIQTGALPPVPGYNLAGNPAGMPAPSSAIAAAAPAAPGAPDEMPPWLRSAMEGNTNPAPPSPRVDPRSPAGRLLARLGMGPSPDSARSFPVAGAPPVPGLPPDNAVSTAAWAPPNTPLPPFPVAGVSPVTPSPERPAELPPWARNATVGANPAAFPPPPAVAEAVPVPRERPAQADLMAIAPPSRAPAAPVEAQPPPVPYTQAGLDRALGVIRQKESSGDYGNVTTTRNRSGQPQSAIGAYGVMDFNVGPWTKEVLGRELTPQEFLNNRAAQDAVARAKLGQYAERYGLTGAAKAWFAGERGMNNPGARDPLGTSVAAYADDFDRKLGLPPEITGGASRPQPSQAMAFDAPTQTAAAAAPPAYGRAVQNLASPQASAAAAEISSEELAALYRNPVTRPIATAFLQKRLDPGVYDFQVAGDQLYRVNKRNGTAEAIPVHQKLMTVGEEQRVYDPNSRTFVGGDSESGKYGKLGANMRWVDVNDKSKGQEAIPGGAATQLPAETAAKVGLGKAFLTRLPDIKQKIENDALGIDVNPAGHLGAMGGLGDSAEIKRHIDSGADALLRMLTGAGMGIQEAHNYAMRYTPTARDTKAQLLSKLKGLEEEIHFTAEQIGTGHGGSPLAKIPKAFGEAAPAAAAPQLQVGKTYYGRPYLGGSPTDPKSWGPRQ